MQAVAVDVQSVANAVLLQCLLPCQQQQAVVGRCCCRPWRDACWHRGGVSRNSVRWNRLDSSIYWRVKARHGSKMETATQCIEDSSRGAIDADRDRETLSVWVGRLLASFLLGEEEGAKEAACDGAVQWGST